LKKVAEKRDAAAAEWRARCEPSASINMINTLAGSQHGRKFTFVS
jgi:hypothetical protein